MLNLKIQKCQNKRCVPGGHFWFIQAEMGAAVSVDGELALPYKMCSVLLSGKGCDVRLKEGECRWGSQGFWVFSFFYFRISVERRGEFIQKLSRRLLRINLNNLFEWLTKATGRLRQKYLLLSYCLMVKQCK